MKYNRPVCGYKALDEPAYVDLKHLKGASYYICSCCRFQFEVDDDIKLDNGKVKRECLENQLKNIGIAINESAHLL